MTTARTGMTPEERIERLERQVDILRRALGLLTVGAQPTVAWVDASFERIENES